MIDFQPRPTRQLRTSRKARTINAPTRPTPPVWPLPTLNGRAPSVIERDARIPGLDLAYLCDPNDATKGHEMPRFVPAFAVADGEIMYAGKQAHGYALVINHNNGWATYYTNLEHMFAVPRSVRPRSRPERVKAGDVLGYVGAPSEREPRCLHFELWKLDEESHFGPADAREHLGKWLQLPWTDERFNPGDAAVLPIAA